MDGDIAPSYAYIIARGHSGSTVLELLLGSHPEIVAVGELEKLSLQFARGERGKCSCENRPADCAFWRKVCDEIHKEFGVDLRTAPFRFRVSDVGLEEDRGIRAPAHWLLYRNSRLWRYLAYARVPVLRYAAALASAHRTWAANRVFVWDTIRKQTGARVVVDSSKDALCSRDLYSQVGGRMKLIFLTRDVRGNVWSYVKRDPNCLQVETERWVRTNQRARRLLRDIPREDWLHVKYEDLCRDLHGTLEKLCGFLGVTFTPTMCQTNGNESHTIGGNRIRYEGVTEVKEDRAWEENFSADDLRRIERTAGPLSRELGYVDGPAVSVG